MRPSDPLLTALPPQAFYFLLQDRGFREHGGVGIESFGGPARWWARDDFKDGG